MERNFYQMPFSLKNWEEFLETKDENNVYTTGVTGSRLKGQNIAAAVKEGDVFFAYVHYLVDPERAEVRTSRFVAALEVVESYCHDPDTKLYGGNFPVLFKVRPISLLDVEHGILASNIKVPKEDLNRFNMILKASLNKHDASYGKDILKALEERSKLRNPPVEPYRDTYTYSQAKKPPVLEKLEKKASREVGKKYSHQWLQSKIADLNSIPGINEVTIQNLETELVRKYLGL